MALPTLRIISLLLYDDTYGVSNTPSDEIKNTATKIRAVLRLENTGGTTTSTTSITLRNRSNTTLGMINSNILFTGEKDFTFNYFSASSICSYTSGSIQCEMVLGLQGVFTNTPLQYVKTVTIFGDTANLEVININTSSENTFVGNPVDITFDIVNTGTASFVPNPSKENLIFISYMLGEVKTTINQYGIQIAEEILPGQALTFDYTFIPDISGEIYICVDVVEE